MDFYFIYIREAHPSDGPQPAQHIRLPRVTTQDERDRRATECCAATGLGLPVLVDDLKNTAATAYNVRTDRFFVLAAGGTVLHRGERGPEGYDLAELDRVLRKRFPAK